MFKWSDRASQITLTPVFHVEQLYVDAYFLDLLNFCQTFGQLTDSRAVLTCMTPHSPILARGMAEAGFEAERYWDRIAQLSDHGIIGLHGHFVRSFDGDQPRPMHCCFYDLDQVKRQIDTELGALSSRGLIGEKNRVYSAGWWFTSRPLRAFLAERGFSWDYSISSSAFNRSQGSDSLPLAEADGMLVQRLGEVVLRSPVAVSGLSKKHRPFHAASKIWRQDRCQTGETLVASLYSHDYDLHLPSALAFTELALRFGLTFSEPWAP
jgi:hypothetical protein